MDAAATAAAPDQAPSDPVRASSPATRTVADANHLTAASGAPAPTLASPSCASEWDRLPGEAQRMVLADTGPFTLFINGLLLRAELQGLPRLQQLQVWQDAVDADWQGDLGLLPWVDVATASLRMTRTFFNRHKHHFKHDTFAAIAVRSGWTDLFDFDRPEDLAAAAARKGDVDLLEDLIVKRKVVRRGLDLAVNAAACGHLQAVQLLHRHVTGLQWNTLVGYVGAKSGDLNLASAVSNAAGVDNLEMLRFIFDRFPDVLDGAPSKFMSSDIHVLEWLDQRWAARGCNTDMMQWVIRRNRCPTQMLVEASAKAGDPALVEWWCTRHGITFGQGELLTAIHSFHYRLVRQLLEPSDIQWDLDAAQSAASSLYPRYAHALRKIRGRNVVHDNTQFEKLGFIGVSRTALLSGMI
ncbi:hypothetical protein HK105_200205 [Polyrhizophydium stewartii]|uniref:Ankyrin repeat protein n=1 Tax=Polyrhizophydium stewartii TaxID=2732419 RepID=A0ABR4NKT1_9FUNG